MEFRDTRYAALAATMPGCDALTLGHFRLLVGLAALVRQDPRKILAWAYFEPAFGLTPAQARRRVADLEEARLLQRQDVDFRRAGGRAGSRYQVTEHGDRVVRLLSVLFARPTAKPRNEPAVAHMGATAGPATTPLAAPVEAADGGVRSIELTDLPEALHKAVLRLPALERRFVIDALREGRVGDEAEARAAGLAAADQIAQFVAQVRIQHGKPAESRSTGANWSAALEAGNNVHRRTIPEEGTRVPAASRVELEAARNAGLPVPEVGPGPEADETLVAIGRLAAAEAAVRYPSLLRGDGGRGFRQRLPELAWAVTTGSLADGGAVIRRVRAALSLMAGGRWGRPRGYDSRFDQRWSRAVSVVCAA